MNEQLSQAVQASSVEPALKPPVPAQAAFARVEALLLHADAPYDAALHEALDELRTALEARASPCGDEPTVAQVGGTSGAVQQHASVTLMEVLRESGLAAYLDCEDMSALKAAQRFAGAVRSRVLCGSHVATMSDELHQRIDGLIAQRLAPDGQCNASDAWALVRDVLQLVKPALSHAQRLTVEEIERVLLSTVFPAGCLATTGERQLRQIALALTPAIEEACAAAWGFALHGAVPTGQQGRWEHCSPALLDSGVDCATTPRRACRCAHGGSHDHWIAGAGCAQH